jgi:hypothetical protein
MPWYYGALLVSSRAMDVSDVRKRLRDVIGRARRAAATRRERNEVAAREWDAVRERVAVPLCRQVVQVLRADGYPLQLTTPADTVRLTSETSAQDVIELGLDTSGDEPVLMCRMNHVRGREIRSLEREVAPASGIAALSDEGLLDLLADVLPPFVER